MEDEDRQRPAVAQWPRLIVHAEVEWEVLAAAIEGPGAVPCRAGDPEVWWSPALELEAAASCASSCPAEAECLAYALAAGERYGVWGARTPAERRVLGGGA